MANNKFYGYSPDSNKEEEGNRLDALNPYEFRKGMDYELTNLGCSRLAESTLEEREKATESVLKNLAENSGHYTSLITYETTYRGVDKAPTFKQWLAEQDDVRMQEVDYKFKNDKMVELKEALKVKIRKVILENKGMFDDDLMDDEVGLDLSGKPVSDMNVREEDEDEDEKIAKKTSVKGAKGKAKQLKELDKEEAALNREKEKSQVAFEKPLAKYKDGKLTASEYSEQTKEHTDKIKEINDRLKEMEVERGEIDLSERLGRREIAKTAYQEGFMAGLQKNK